MLTKLAQGFLDLSSGALDAVGGLGGLLTSPFTRYISLMADNEMLGILNWLFPVSDAVAIMELWCLCIGSYYAFKFFKGVIGKANLLG